MKQLRHLLPILLLSTILASSFSKASAQDANMYVILPSAADSYWNITFTSTLTWQQYTFLTDPTYYPTGYLGYLPQGNYDIYFTGFNFNSFTYSIGNNIYQGSQQSGSTCSFYSVPIINVTTISMQQLTP